MTDKLIFFVDDEPMFINLLEYTFNCRKGCSVKTFQSGEACIEHLNLNPDLVVIDFFLDSDKMTGMEVAKTIREMNPAITLAFLTGNDDYAVIEEAKSIGIDKYVLKDGYFIDNLIEYISNLFPSTL